MATQALDWLSLEDARFELRVAAQADVDNALLRYIRSAVAEVAQYTGLPLIDREAITECTPAHSRIVGPLMYPFKVMEARYWRDAMYPDPPDVEIDPVPTITPLDPNQPRGRYAVQFGAELPADLIRVRLTLKAGIMPADFPHVSQAVILRVREMFGGHIQQPSGMAPLWQRVLADTGYWNAVDAEG